MTTTKAKLSAAKTPKTTAKTTAKTASKPKSATHTKAAVPAAAPVTPVVVNTMQPVVSHSMMRKRELIDLVVERSGIKKKDAKPVIEAVLAELGDALAAGRELNLQPMGKLKVRRAKQTPNGRVMVVKMRQSHDISSTPDADDVKDAAE